MRFSWMIRRDMTKKKIRTKNRKHVRCSLVFFVRFLIDKFFEKALEHFSEKIKNLLMKILKSALLVLFSGQMKKF